MESPGAGANAQENGEGAKEAPNGARGGHPHLRPSTGNFERVGQRTVGWPAVTLQSIDSQILEKSSNRLAFGWKTDSQICCEPRLYAAFIDSQVLVADTAVSEQSGAAVFVRERRRERSRCANQLLRRHTALTYFVKAHTF